VVEMREPDLFYLTHIKDTLSKEFGRPFDIVTFHKSMNKLLKARIKREVVYA
jgi:predicted nucleotidyltransferase